MEQLKGTVERVIYRNKENGYTVLKISVGERKEAITAVGTMPDIRTGFTVSLSGYWKIDARYGRQFFIVRVEKMSPSTSPMEELFQNLARSKFRSRFSLKDSDKAYVREKGIDTVRRHAEDFIRLRLAPAQPVNDGKQTPMKGHPVFVAQHATGSCCRGCLEKWHQIPRGVELTEKQQEYVVEVIMEWIERQVKDRVGR